LGEKITLSADSKEGLELLVIGVAVSKEKNLTISKPLLNPKAILLQMDFVVPKENGDAFEKMYYSVYVPAMTVQKVMLVQSYCVSFRRISIKKYRPNQHV
jgi:hypothetical protein